MSIDTTGFQTTTQQATLRPGDAVWLHAVRNSSLPLSPSYQRMMEAIRQQCADLSTYVEHKGASSGQFLGRHREVPSSPMRPQVPQALRKLERLRQEERLRAALASWV